MAAEPGLLTLLTVAGLGVVGVRLASGARRAAGGPPRPHTRHIIGGLHRRHFLFAPLALFGVLFVADALYTIPLLRFGWLTAIGGTGNIVTGGTTRTAGTALEWLVPLVFLALLAPALPLFAEREELIFRRGAERWSFWRRAWQGLKFGLVHLIMGIPIAVALALSVGGWYFTWAYLRGFRRSQGDQREAVLESTRTHLAYNSVILGIVAIAIVGTLLTGCSVNNKPPVTNTLSLTSPAFATNHRIPDKYTCVGDNVSPLLAWSDVPNHA